MEHDPNRPRERNTRDWAKPRGITERLNEIYGGGEGETVLDPVLARLQERSLPPNGGGNAPGGLSREAW